jgi:magnesium transporter
MSDHEEPATPLGYVPIEELDDHRHQTPATHLQERPRRGTFDSLYGARHLDSRAAADGHEAEGTSIRVRDFEEALTDDDDMAECPPTRQSARRPTFGTHRSESPPNSVKAFAEARRREHDGTGPDGREDRQGEDDGLRRTVSLASRRSMRSRGRTVDEETASLSSHASAQADVCFPVQEERQKETLAIDFEYLEDFIADQRISRVGSHMEPDVRIFSDLRPQATAGSGEAAASSLHGRIHHYPDDVMEKAAEAKEVESPDETRGLSADPNRICFFSSAWESTIHAAELRDLVLPGEDLRNLFMLPPGEDGVWWLNLNNPSKEEVVAICKAFGVHPLTTEDIATQESREKIELFPSYYFACFRSFNKETDDDGFEEYEPFNIYAIVFREGTLSFSFAPNSHASNVRKRIALLKDFVALSSDWICYALM